tara:strand:+ start:32775 stop:32963 length:189 start_codon:yes stop_codon:yes gene_type:complete
MSEYINYSESSERLVDNIMGSSIGMGNSLIPTLTILIVVGLFSMFAYKIHLEGRWLNQFDAE